LHLPPSGPPITAAGTALEPLRTIAPSTSTHLRVRLHGRSRERDRCAPGLPLARPSPVRDSAHSPGLGLRVVLLATVLFDLAEGLCPALSNGSLAASALGPLASPALRALDSYWRTRSWTLTHPWTAGLVIAAVLGFGGRSSHSRRWSLLTVRQGIVGWSGLKARLTGTAFREATFTFPMRRVDLVSEPPPRHSRPAFRVPLCGLRGASASSPHQRCPLEGEQSPCVPFEPQEQCAMTASPLSLQTPSPPCAVCLRRTAPPGARPTG